MVIQNVRERLLVSKWKTPNFDMETFELRKPNDLKVIDEYHVKTSDRFVGLKSFGNGRKTSRA
jgi:predicted cupin superfamily sugar epimerase